MKGVLKNKDSLRSIVEPIDSSSKIFGTLGASTSFIQEFEDDGIYVCAVDEDETVFVNYKLDIDSIFDSYEVVKDKIGIWETTQLTKIFKKYIKFYDDDEKVSIDFRDNRYIIRRGKEEDTFYTAPTTQIRRGEREIDTSSLKAVANFKLQGKELSKLLTNIDIYTTQTSVAFEGDAENGDISAKVCSPDKPNQSYGTSTISANEIEANFEFEFVKSKIKSILECSDEYEVTFFANNRGPVIGHFTYTKNGYDMNFYVGPNRKRKQ